MLDILNYIMINQCKISALASRFVFLAFDYIMLLSPLQWMNQWAAEFAGFQFVLLASKRTSIVDRMKSNNPPGPSRRLQTRNHAQQPLARSRPPPPLLPHTDLQNLLKFDKCSQILYRLQKMLQPLSPCLSYKLQKYSSQAGLIFNAI